ncbi:MAG: ATP-binding protein [Gemmatimonadales bacterium]|nr:ATP-binding protein [Gemmatimonadales bacterium]
MQDLALHILDVVENAIAASARKISLVITEDTTRDLLSIVIEDDGKGMDADTREKVLDPFFTTRTTRRVGLGLPLLAQAAREGGGGIEIASEPGKGTRVKAWFRRSHPDCKPLGDIVETIRTIVTGRPDLALRYEHRIDGEAYAFDTADLKPGGPA